MARAIDADELKETLVFHEEEYTVAAHCIIDMMPTINTVKHGKWKDDSNYWICNQCNEYLFVTDGSMDMNYCPHCGAKMDGE